MTTEITLKINKKLDAIFSHIADNVETYSFNLVDLPEINEYKTDIRLSRGFEDIFQALNKRKSNCIYWFELDDIISCQNLIDKLDKIRDSLLSNIRIVPPRNNNIGSKVLYLGIRRGGFRKSDGMTNIAGRMVQHLGYYKKGSTQGLQLAHWCKDIDLILKLNVVELEGLPNDYLNVAEKILAYHLKPMCGKH